MLKAYKSDYIYYDSKIYNNSWLLVDGSTIKEVTVNMPTNDNIEKVIFENSAIFPGFVNTHAHMGMSVFRGYADDLPLMEWLNNHIWPLENKYISEELVYLATMLSSAESIRGGVTMVNEMYFHPESAQKAFIDAGIRGIIGFGAMNSLGDIIKKLENYNYPSDLIEVAIAPHALYTTSKEIMKQCINFAKNNNILLHTHLAETEDETKIITNKYGKTPVMLMNELGGFDCRSLFAHSIHMDSQEMKVMGDKGVNISHCLTSNLKLASGFAPIKELSLAGVNITVGTDGACSNNTQSVLNEISLISKFHKGFTKDATTIPAQEVLTYATENAGKIFSSKKIGKLSQGYKADFFVISFDATHMTPVYNPLSHLVYAAKDTDITDVYINGKAIMKNSKILTFDEAEIKTKARTLAKLISNK